MKNKKNTKALLGKNIGYSLIVLVFLLVILLVAPGRGCGAIIFLLALSAIIYIVIWWNILWQVKIHRIYFHRIWIYHMP